MKVKILHVFRSRSLGRTLQKGEIVDGTEDWAKEIEAKGLGKIIEQPDKNAKPARRTKRINKKKVETAAVEPPKA